jgi:hypothetical protein
MRRRVARLGGSTVKISSKQLLGGSAGLAALGAISISASGAREWLDTITAVIQHPATVTLMIVLIAILLAWLFIRSAQSNEECEDRVRGLQQQCSVQQSQLDAIYLLLSLDRRYAARLPSIDDWRTGRIDMRYLASAGHEPERRGANEK